MSEPVVYKDEWPLTASAWEQLRAQNAALAADRDALRNELDGYRKANDLLNKGLESQCEQAHGLKQALRAAGAERDRLLAERGTVLGYAVVVVREDGMHFLERFWLADVADTLGALRRARQAAERLTGHVQASEQVSVCAITRVEDEA